MTRPNLEDLAERTAYRRELMGIMRGPRYFGMVLILGGVFLYFWARFFGGPWFIGNFQTTYIGWTLIAIGWAIWIVVIIRRTRYHARRMAEPAVTR